MVKTIAQVIELPGHYIRNSSSYPGLPEVELPDKRGTQLSHDDDSPFLRFVGIEYVQSAGGVGSVSLSVQAHHLQAAGQVHGGLISVLADTACFRAVRSLLSPGQRTTTVELKVNFLESANSGRLTAVATIVSNKDRLMVADIEVNSDDGRLIAQGLGTFLVMGSG